MKNRTIGELFSVLYPGIIFGAIIGFIISIWLETVTSGVLAKVLEYNSQSKGIMVIGIFSIAGALIQYYMGWAK